MLLFQNSHTGVASSSPFYLDINTEFQLTDFSTVTGLLSISNTWDFELPSSSWSIDDIELNFTDVESGIEVKVIEDNPINMLTINKFHDGFGVQIVIHDPTIIYGFEIYGNNESTENKPIYVQINGMDNNSYTPNNIIYGTSQLLNMSYSLTPQWHIQSFSSPIYLTEGNYYLVINGTSIGTSPKSDYNWYFNNIDPTYPELNTSEYSGISWGSAIEGTPFLHKIIQKVNQTFFPEEINMTMELNGNSYEISNGNDPGKGYLKKTNLNYHPNKKKVEVNIKNNKTASLDFNLSYKLNISNDFNAPSILTINFNSSNVWKITPYIERFSLNDSIKFHYSNSWSNISIIKNQLDISSDVFIDLNNNLIIIPNHTIENGAEWEIIANSPSVEFELNIIETKWFGGQELRFSIADPILEGTYKFVLRDEEGIELHQEVKTLPADLPNKFTFEIPPNILEGNYTAYVYWYNQTDAGIQTRVFSFSPKRSTLDLTVIFITVGLVLIGGVVLGGSGYVTYKKVQTRHSDKLKLILEKCSEIMDIEYIIVLDKKSGIDVYSEAFGDKQVEPTLISGFLQAIQNFGSEVLGRAKESRTFKVEYQKSILLMTEFVNLRVIIIMKESPSKNFLYTMESLAFDIYHQYGTLFDEFQGNLAEFQGIRDLLEEHLNISFLYPLTIDYSLKMKLSPSEREIVKRASDFMRDHKQDHFYSIYLLPDNICTPKDFEIIKQLIEKKIFNPIDTSSD
ncbi:MAG: hypothetical protein ACFFD7_14390 [Candidatus Thorarchaeota archaeon]